MRDDEPQVLSLEPSQDAAARLLFAIGRKVAEIDSRSA
jgi:hypothetical protein